jgi:hypothetical protein
VAQLVEQREKGSEEGRKERKGSSAWLVLQKAQLLSSLHCLI